MSTPAISSGSPLDHKIYRTFMLAEQKYLTLNRRISIHFGKKHSPAFAAIFIHYLLLRLLRMFSVKVPYILWHRFEWCNLMIVKFNYVIFTLFIYFRVNGVIKYIYQWPWKISICVKILRAVIRNSYNSWYVCYVYELHILSRTVQR